MNEFLVSIKPEFVARILSGEKTVEVRSRRVNIPNGARLWIYSTLPVGCIEVAATVPTVRVGPPEEIWAAFSATIGVSRSTFLRYANGSSTISAIVLNNIVRLQPPLHLDEIREIAEGFSPPQFMKTLKPGGILSSVLTDHVAENTYLEAR